jgi:ribosomal protein L2
MTDWRPLRAHVCGLKETGVETYANSAFRFKTVKETMVAAEGMYEGQFIYCGKKAQLKIGNIMPVSAMPEGACPRHVCHNR